MLTRPESITRCTVSFVFVLLTQSALCLIPLFLPDSPILLQLPVAAATVLIVIGLSSRCRKLIGLSASAHAFVFFSVLFVFCVYLFVVRQANSRTLDVLFNGEVVLLLLGLCRFLYSDPGMVVNRSSSSEELTSNTVLGVESHDESDLLRRVRYCKICKAHIKGFDHHCPAFGNCVGQNNHLFFTVLLSGLIITEATYVVCSFQFARKFGNLNRTRLKASLGGILANSTMLFALFQVVWQTVFLAWHLYCVCFNIRTDEWINWKRYPEFQQTVQCRPGESHNRIEFSNPYDNGIIQNVKEFLASKGYVRYYDHCI